MNTSKSNIQRLAEIHVRRYTNMLKSNSININLRETARYLDIWKSIEAKACNWEDLNKVEKQEVGDAVRDEDY